MSDKTVAGASEFAALMTEQRRGREEPVWTWMAEHHPEFMEPYNRLAVLVFGYDGAGRDDHSTLGVKTKELIGLAIMASQRDWERFPPHMKRLIDLGATDDEIVEALMVAALYGGSPGLRYGVELLMRMRGVWPSDEPAWGPAGV